MRKQIKFESLLIFENEIRLGTGIPVLMYFTNVDAVIPRLPFVLRELDAIAAIFAPAVIMSVATFIWFGNGRAKCPSSGSHEIEHN